MKIDISEIKELLNSNVTGYRIGQETNVKQQNYDRYKKGVANLDDMPLKTAKELQNYININKEELKMLNINNIKNADYIWAFSELGEFIDENQNFNNKGDFEWWRELANALAYLEEEQEIDTKALEINELEDYVTIAEEHGFINEEE